MAVLPSFRRWLGLKTYQFEVTFGVYMYTPWEKFYFYSLFFLLFGLTFIAAILYLPHHISILSGRVWYYINGEHIDVAASARKAVENMTTSILHDSASTVTQILAQTDAKEL